MSDHGLSQQGIWVSFWTPKPLNANPQDTQFEKFLTKCQSLAYNEFFHLHTIPIALYKNIMPYILINLCIWNLNIALWTPLKIWTPQKFTIANFGHPVSNWLRPCVRPCAYCRCLRDKPAKEKGNPRSFPFHLAYLDLLYLGKHVKMQTQLIWPIIIWGEWMIWRLSE